MKAAPPSPRGLGKRSEGDSRACRPHRPLAKSFGVARVPAAEHMANYQAARRSWARERAAQRRALRRRRNQRNDPGDRLQRNEEVLMLSKPSLRGAAAKYQIACSRMKPQGCERHRWVKPRGRNERERVSRNLRSLQPQQKAILGELLSMLARKKTEPARQLR